MNRTTVASVEPFTAADHAAKVICAMTGALTFEAALILGSGWAEAAGELGEVRASVVIDDLPGFPAPTVPGHENVLRSVEIDGRRILVFGGRSHLYEGHSAQTVVHPIRTAFAAGCETVILTNAAGSLNADWQPGQPVLISDHLNLTGNSPMVGPAPAENRPGRFCDLGEVYSSRLRAIAQDIADLPEGVYAGLLGGNYETPAEIRMLAGQGAQLVGMSTVLEAIAARHLGMEVLGISLVTNMAAGLGDGQLDHSDVLSESAAARPRMIELLRSVIRAM
ncbi:MAG: purine-nucleoside phosphorylase [Acidimicrobiales bacterium]